MAKGIGGRPKKRIKRVMPDQGIGTASSRVNLKGKRKLRSPALLVNRGNQEPHPGGRKGDYIPGGPVAKKRMRNLHPKRG